LDNLYDVVFMTYEANVTAYGTKLLLYLLIIVPHDIDWVKDRVRWYWENKLFKHRKSVPEPSVADSTIPTITVSEEKSEPPKAGSSVTA
jgi:hypothetical protein